MKSLIITSYFLLAFGVVFAQKSNQELKGDKYYKMFSYTSAIENYNQIDDLTLLGKRRLAESYMHIDDFANSATAYSEFVSADNVTATDLFNYASVLRMLGNYSSSDNWMAKLHQKFPFDTRGKNFVDGQPLMSKITKDEGRYSISNLAFNSGQQDFGPAFFGDQIVFASSRERVKSVKRRYNWNGLPFLDLYLADRNNQELATPLQLNKKVNKKMHEGPASFTKDGNYMAFTKNNYADKSADGTVKLKIFFLERNSEGKWGKEVPFKLNSAEFSVAHPCLSNDGKVMYFSSDMPGGNGGTDIYKIEKDASGSWGTAMNLGSSINTEGQEMFPFFHEEGKLLFFSSNGQVGLGGLDVFVAPEGSDGNFPKVVNAGAPLNTNMDDFSIILDKDLKYGYFASNRDGGKGDDDIYSFELLKPFTFGVTINGIVKDNDGNKIENAIVNLYDTDGNVAGTAKSGSNGAFTFVVDRDQSFTLNGTKTDYFDGAGNVTSKTTVDMVQTELLLEKDPGIALGMLILDKETSKPLEGVRILITDNITGKQFADVVTDSDGDFLKGLAGKRLNDRLSYGINVSKSGYFPVQKTFNHKITEPGVINVNSALGNFELEKEIEDLSILINPINFDLGKYKIRKDASVELNKIVAYMNKYPNMVVELGAHTDCRGSKRSNESLSDKRAKASAAYIQSRITNPTRISGKGYGESRLLNGCACEGAVKSDCSEDEHSKNRRTEFKVVSVGDSKVGVKNTSTQSFDE